MARISVAEAAEALGVHPQRVHQRIRDGSLPAERIGRQWSIDSSDLALVRHRTKAGRPLSARSAWALVAIAAEDEKVAAQMEPSERSRARSRLRALLQLASEEDLNEAGASLIAALGNRARRLLFVAPVRDLPDIRGDRRLRLSGVSVPGSNISTGDLTEGYVLAREIDRLVEDYLLTPHDRRRANLIVHVVDGESERLVPVDVAGSLLIQAADLAEHHGIRETNEALRLLAQLQVELASGHGGKFGADDG